MFFGLNWLTSSSIKRESCITFYQVITWGKWQLALQEERQKRKVKQSFVINLQSSRKADRPLETLTPGWWGFFLFVREFENRKKLHVKKETKSWSSNAFLSRDPFPPGRHLLYLRLTPLNPFFMCSFNFLKVKSSSVSWRVLTSNYLPW